MTQATERAGTDKTGEEELPRILLVDDDTELCALVAEFLGARGFMVESEGDGGNAVERVRHGRHSLMVLDVMLPTIDGFEVLRRLRGDERLNALPVIMLTAHGDEIDRIVGLEMGADDYLPKPFNPRELLARVRAILRRSQANATAAPAAAAGATAPSTAIEESPDAQAAPHGHERFRQGDIELDVEARAVQCAGRPVELTAVEFDLLRVLMAAAGRVVKRDQLAQQALQRKLLPFDRSLDIHISKLRRKLQIAAGKKPGQEAENVDEHIKTIRGVGYIFVMPQEDV